MVWSPGPINETDATNGWWQMTVPVVEKSCAVFGSNDVVGLKQLGRRQDCPFRQLCLYPVAALSMLFD